MCVGQGSSKPRVGFDSWKCRVWLMKWYTWWSAFWPRLYWCTCLVRWRGKKWVRRACPCCLERDLCAWRFRKAIEIGPAFPRGWCHPVVSWAVPDAPQAQTLLKEMLAFLSRKITGLLPDIQIVWALIRIAMKCKAVKPWVKYNDKKK